MVETFLKGEEIFYKMVYYDTLENYIGTPEKKSKVKRA